MVSISGGLFSLRLIYFIPAYVANRIRTCILCLVVSLLLFPFSLCSRTVSPQRLKCYSSKITRVAYVSFLLKTNSVIFHSQYKIDMVLPVGQFELEIYIHSCCQ